MYLLGALSVLGLQSIHSTIMRINDNNIEQKVRNFEKLAIDALNNNDVAMVRAIVSLAINYINKIKPSSSLLEIAAFKHILARVENKERNYETAEVLLKEIKDLYEACCSDSDDVYATVLEDYAASLQGQGRTYEAIESMHKAAEIFDQIEMLEDYQHDDSNNSTSSSLLSAVANSILDKEKVPIEISPDSKELSEYLDSFSNIYNTTTTNNVYYTSSVDTSSNPNSHISASISTASDSVMTPSKITYRHHLIRYSNKKVKRPSSPVDLDDFCVDDDDDDDHNNSSNTNSSNTNSNENAIVVSTENIITEIVNDENMDPNLKTENNIVYSLKPIKNPILNSKPRRPLSSSSLSSLTPLKSSPSSSFFCNIDKIVVSPTTPLKQQIVTTANLVATPNPSSSSSSSSPLRQTKSPFDVTKDLCLSVSANSVRVRSNIGKMMMDEHRFADANEIFCSVLETCKFLSKQNIDVDSIVKEVSNWKSIINHSVINRISDDDDDDSNNNCSNKSNHDNESKECTLHF